MADAVIPMTAAVEAQSFQLSTGPATLVELQANISFVERKAEYYKGFRQLGNIYRTGLNLAYTFDSVEVHEMCIRDSFKYNCIGLQYNYILLYAKNQALVLAYSLMRFNAHKRSRLCRESRV